jgi:hypothetical protein
MKLNEVLNLKELQMTTTDEAIKREIVKQLIYKRADLIAVGTKIVGVREFDNLDVKFAFPSEAGVEYPVPEGAGASLSTITWTEFGFSLAKAEGRFMITDEAQIRGVDRTQWETGIRRLGEGLAKKKDENILSALAAGAGNSFAATATWDTATASQITGDVAKAVNYILSAKGVLDTDIKNIAFVVPVKAWSGLLRVLEIEGVRMSMFNWLTQSYGISIYPTKYFTSDGIALLTGEDTAVHGVLRPPAGIPLVETKRHEGIGTEYIVRQFFGTKVVPEEAGVSTSNRIVKITSVAS